MTEKTDSVIKAPPGVNRLNVFRSGLRIALRLGVVGLAGWVVAIAIESEALAFIAGTVVATSMVLTAVSIMYVSGEVTRETRLKDLGPFAWCYLLGFASLTLSQLDYTDLQYYKYGTALLWFVCYGVAAATLLDRNRVTWQAGALAIYAVTVFAGLGVHKFLGASDWAWQAAFFMSKSILWWKS